MGSTDKRTAAEFAAEMLELKIIRLIETNRHVTEAKARRIVAKIPVASYAGTFAAETTIRQAALAEFMQSETWRDYSKL